MKIFGESAMIFVENIKLIEFWDICIWWLKRINNFVYDKNNHPIWPALAINYTNKTQYIYRINKGILNVVDDSVNDKMPNEIRPVPFTNMIYIGDSVTDIPCMRLIMKNGGYAIGVYDKEHKNKEYLNTLINQNRINYAFESDYSKNSELEEVVKEIIQLVKHSTNLQEANKEQKQYKLWSKFGYRQIYRIMIKF